MKNNKMIVILSLFGLLLLSYASFGFLKSENDLDVKNRFGSDRTPTLDQARSGYISEEYQIDESDFLNAKELIGEDSVGSELTGSEINGLLLMREEEKLARDVYLALYDIWGTQIFSNIAASETTHMAAVGDLISRYGLTDPITSDTRGVFANQDLQKLYTDLVTKGGESKEEAMRVGALIEDLDIADLERLINETDKDDIRLVYENLQKGSRNHLRAFTKQIERTGGSYKPTYISIEEYETIINSEQERGRVQ